MMDLVSKMPGVQHGLCVVSLSGSASGLFIQMHYLSKFLSAKKRILIVTNSLNETNYRIISSKLAVRWDRSLITLLDFGKLSGKEFETNEEAVIEEICKAITKEPEVSLLVFTDLSVMERVGISSSAVTCLISRLYSQMSSDALIIMTFPIETKACTMLSDRADFLMNVDLIGSGYGKDVTGKLTITIRGGNVVTETKQLLYLTGERSIKCFYPGNRCLFGI